jgi:hypothetical protein
MIITKFEKLGLAIIDYTNEIIEWKRNASSASKGTSPFERS